MKRVGDRVMVKASLWVSVPHAGEMGTLVAKKGIRYPYTVQLDSGEVIRVIDVIKVKEVKK